MEKYVVSFELADKLEAAGYPQKSEYFWSDQGNDDWMVLSKSSDWLKEGRDIAAPLSDELLKQLADIRGGYWLGTDWDLVLAEDYYRLLGRDELPSFDGDKPADALAKLWLYCKEHGYLPTQEETR